MLRMVLISLLLTGLLSAQEKNRVLSDLVNQALERNPKIKAAAREAEAYSFRILPSRTLPDPMLEFSMKNMGLSSFTLGQDPQSGLVISFSQVFPFPGKLKLNGEIAILEQTRKQLEYEAVKREIIRELKTAYYELCFGRKTVEIYTRQKDLLLQARKLSEEKYAVGSGIQSDVLKASTEITRMDEAIIPLRDMTRVLEVKINLLLDFPLDRPLEGLAIDEDIGLPLSLAELQAQALEFSPLGQEAKLMEAEKTKMVALARKEFLPDFRITAGWEYKGRLTDMFEGMIGLEIPLYRNRRQLSMLKEAQAREASARENVSAVKNDIITMLTESYLKARTAESLVALYKNTLRIQARLTFESSMANYQVNKVDFQALLMDIGGQFAVEMAYYRELVQFWTAMAALEFLTAKPVVYR